MRISDSLYVNSFFNEISDLSCMLGDMFAINGSEQVIEFIMSVIITYKLIHPLFGGV